MQCSGVVVVVVVCFTYAGVVDFIVFCFTTAGVGTGVGLVDG